jgi:hypothetical protein
MSDIEPEERLSDAATQAIAGWMRLRQAERRSGPVAPLVPELVRYLCGALSPDAATAVEERLIDTGKTLRILREVRAELLRMEAIPWQSVSEAALGDDQRAVVAATWLALISEQVQAAEHAPARWLADGWQNLRDQMAAGIEEAQMAWNAFAAFGTQWGRALYAPGRFALERGGNATATLPGITAPVLIEAEIDPDDVLRVTLQIETQSEDSDPDLDGRSVLLSLRSGAEFWPLATASLHAGSAEWSIPGFGAMTGMPTGEIPPEALQFTFPDTPAPAPEAPLRLLAEITDRDGAATERAPTPIIFLEEPRWAGGEFLARVELPAETRYWMTVRYQIRLDVAVSGSHWQHLGAWTLADGGDAPHTLQASCPSPEPV